MEKERKEKKRKKKKEQKQRKKKKEGGRKVSSGFHGLSVTTIPAPVAQECIFVHVCPIHADSKSPLPTVGTLRSCRSWGCSDKSCQTAPSAPPALPRKKHTTLIIN